MSIHPFITSTNTSEVPTALQILPKCGGHSNEQGRYGSCPPGVPGLVQERDITSKYKCAERYKKNCEVLVGPGN